MKQKDLYVLTGFLGAGKTSFLLHILEHSKGKKIGVIQNEFGKTGIDGEIIRRDGIEMREINRGSIFCSCLKLSFVQALAEMGEQDLDCVFVESSGLADPSNIEEILEAVKLLKGDVYSFKGVICLIDGVHFPEQKNDLETVKRQLAHCHMAVINKVDLIDDAKLEKVIDAVRKINPVCPLAVCEHGKMEMDFFDENLTAFQWAAFEESVNTEENRPKTITLESEETVAMEILTAFLRQVLPDCYRIKGFFRLEEGWHQVDVVEDLIDYKTCGPHMTSQLVFLSKTGPKIIRSIDKAWKETVKLSMRLKN